MSRNNSGFTIIELLAAIVVLGVLMGSAVPIVISVMNDQKNDIYIEDAIRLGSNADYKIRSDNKLQIPSRDGGCIIIGLSYMNNNAFGKAPYGGEYDLDASFVVARRNSYSEAHEYTYYVRLIEKTETGSYRGVNLKEVDALYADDARDTCVENMGASVVFNLADKKGDSTFASFLSSNNVACQKDIWIYTGE